MDYIKTAEGILQQIGGKENISHLTHCSTRVRLTLVDDSLADYKALESVPGVIGVRNTGQCQIIIGNEVIEVYDALRELVGDTTGSQGAQENKKWSAVVLDFVISIFQPLIPAMAGGGVLKSLLLLLVSVGWMEKGSTAYAILDAIGSAPLYFLPILVAITTAMKLKVNVIVAVSAVGALLIPSMTKLLASGAVVFEISLQNVPYAYQVFPAILTVLFYSQMERLVTRYAPKSIRVFFVPLVCLAVTVPVTLLLLGPLGYTVGTGMSTVILAIFHTLGFVAVALLAAILPFMIATGMHKAMIPYAVNAMSQFGKEVLYLPASLAHNIAEAGASFAVALKSKDVGLRSTAISAGISALFGITEPAIYGVTLLHKRVLYSVMIGGAIGGAVMGLFGIEAFALVGPGLASISMFTSPDNSMNLIYALISVPISFFAAFLSTLILWHADDGTKQQDDAEPVATAEKAAKAFPFKSPISGEVIPIEQVNDDVFSAKLIGDGIAIIPDDNVLYAPVDGVVTSIYATGHAVNFIADNGAEIIFHIGLDTVQLEGKFFEPMVRSGERVKSGQPLVKFQRENIEQSGYDTVVVCVITNSNEYKIQPVMNNNQVKNQDVIMMVEELA
ncbi:beta-glucoside-specific PTS transporter subunit IIABC [Celerinatantimonas diazotrophica]|uniref:PTS system beta-glucoside-specific IIA component (Glc family) /PTS system beta-glucoside-specific IIB component (Glc family) /PTS system beta-glucoside-specific IIC component (Glc family) n=1 Tax=Celerinatantimonas diazotrophica TaxID=412034 RepID=A0A4R1KHA3_9GAMM|nr:beta-glucoside-specific PTS transporter subunit IIABC [Celerinatantimonas diazotrophica]TCK62769.1 PTS system beta-glucoside-specific IIA component (Glc family) /PTS system beta-glucoside-specific IIB component (Glc family) /PTS system beta-glucoside-specific IIC component (Glc family) [Celerinatantimonas diazotrophica]CAG9298399.1 PTS system beta-glucoside-specific EIIBCA component [Celerinatantimonas diazotrophica]